MLDVKIIAQPRTIKLALDAAMLKYPIDYEAVRILTRVMETGEADMETIIKYRDVNVKERV